MVFSRRRPEALMLSGGTTCVFAYVWKKEASNFVCLEGTRECFEAAQFTVRRKQLPCMAYFSRTWETRSLIHFSMPAL